MSTWAFTSWSQRGRPSDALPYLETAVRIDPSSAPAHTQPGIALAMTGRLCDALRHFEKTERLSPNPKLEQVIADLRAQLK
ncbi:MAG: tetratricopeptide repeat protein [Acidobacteriota bacterium]